MICHTFVFGDPQDHRHGGGGSGPVARLPLDLGYLPVNVAR